MILNITISSKYVNTGFLPRLNIIVKTNYFRICKTISYIYIQYLSVYTKKATRILGLDIKRIIP